MDVPSDVLTASRAAEDVVIAQSGESVRVKKSFVCFCVVWYIFSVDFHEL